jgi:hypothetical protein
MVSRFCNFTDIKAISQEFFKFHEYRLVGETCNYQEVRIIWISSGRNDSQSVNKHPSTGLDCKA